MINYGSVPGYEAEWATDWEVQGLPTCNHVDFEYMFAKHLESEYWSQFVGRPGGCVCVCALPHWTNPPKIGSIFIVFVCDRYSYFRLSLEEVFASLLWVRCGDICTWYVETLNERGTRWPFAPSVRMETKTKVCALFTIRRQNKQAAHA